MNHAALVRAKPSELVPVDRARIILDTLNEVEIILSDAIDAYKEQHPDPAKQKRIEALRTVILERIKYRRAEQVCTVKIKILMHKIADTGKQVQSLHSGSGKDKLSYEKFLYLSRKRIKRNYSIKP